MRGKFHSYLVTCAIFLLSLIFISSVFGQVYQEKEDSLEGERFSQYYSFQGTSPQINEFGIKEGIINSGENNLPEIFGYIIELESEPLAVKEVDLKEELVETRKYIETHSIFNPVRLYKQFFGVSSEKVVEARLENHEDKIDKEHLEVKKDILDELGKTDSSGNVRLSPDEEKELIIDEFKDLFNGVVLNVDEEEAKKIEKLDGVKAVYPNKLNKLLMQEALPLIGATDSWQLMDSLNRKLTGQGVKIAILDTGIDYSHPDFGSCTLQQIKNGQCTKIIGGYDYSDNDENFSDYAGHGTHVAGIAAGKGDYNNNNVYEPQLGEFWGVAPDAKLIIHKVFPNSYDYVIIKAIESAVGNGSNIISMSLGGRGNPDDPMSKAVDNAVDLGVTVVVAAGNSGPGGNIYCLNENTGAFNSICSPGTARKAITVGATYDSGFLVDQITSFSSRGPSIWKNMTGEFYLSKPDIVAPGNDICSSAYPSPLATGFCVNPNHIALSGTSMATPIVAGAVALVKQKNPLWTPEQIKNALKSTANYGSYDSSAYGSGRLNITSLLSLTSVLPIASLSEIGTLNYLKTIRGSAFGAGFSSYSLYYKKVDQVNWILLSSSNTPVSNGILYNNANFISLFNGIYDLKLEVLNTNGRISRDVKSFRVNAVELLTIGKLSGILSQGTSPIRGIINFDSIQNYKVKYKLRSAANWEILCEGNVLYYIPGNITTICNFNFNSLKDLDEYSFKLFLTHENTEFQSLEINATYYNSLLPGWPLNMQDMGSHVIGRPFFVDYYGRPNLILTDSHKTRRAEINGTTIDIFRPTMNNHVVILYNNSNSISEPEFFVFRTAPFFADVNTGIYYINGTAKRLFSSSLFGGAAATDNGFIAFYDYTSLHLYKNDGLMVQGFPVNISEGLENFVLLNLKMYTARGNTYILVLGGNQVVVGGWYAIRQSFLSLFDSNGQKIWKISVPDNLLSDFSIESVSNPTEAIFVSSSAIPLNISSISLESGILRNLFSINYPSASSYVRSFSTWKTGNQTFIAVSIPQTNNWAYKDYPYIALFNQTSYLRNITATYSAIQKVSLEDLDGNNLPEIVAIEQFTQPYCSLANPLRILLKYINGSMIKNISINTNNEYLFDSSFYSIKQPTIFRQNNVARFFTTYVQPFPVNLICASGWLPGFTPIFGLEINQTPILSVSPPSVPPNPYNEKALCVYNNNSQISKDVCDYYLMKRPGAKSLGINVTDDLFLDGIIRENMNSYNFARYVAKPLFDSVNLRSDWNITHLAVAKDIPIRVHLSGEIISANHLLSIESSSYTTFQIPIESSSYIVNASYYQKSKHFNPREHVWPGYNSSYRFAVSHLTGYNITDIKMMIDRAVGRAPNLSKSFWLLDIDSDQFPFVNATINRLSDNLAFRGINRSQIISEFTDQSPLVFSDKELVAYVGPGVHHAGYSQGWIASNPRVLAEVSNRSIFTSIESFNAFSFNGSAFTNRENTNQGKLADVITSGAFGGNNYSRIFAGSFGNVHEPYIGGLPSPNIIFSRYASGLTFAESFLSAFSSSGPNDLGYGWWSTTGFLTRSIAVGDPLMKISDSIFRPLGEVCNLNGDCISGFCGLDKLGVNRCKASQNGCSNGEDGSETHSGSAYCLNNSHERRCSNGQWLPSNTCAQNYQCEQILSECKLIKGQMCSQNSDCSRNICSFDIAGVKRCASNLNDCVLDSFGTETDNGKHACVDENRKKQCLNTVWQVESLSCLQGCSNGKCGEENYFKEPANFSVPKGENFFFVPTVNVSGKNLSQIFSSIPSFFQVYLFRFNNILNYRDYVGSTAFFGPFSPNPEMIVGEGISLPSSQANLSLNLTGQTYTSAPTINISRGINLVGFPYCGAVYNASQLLLEMNRSQINCSTISQPALGRGPVEWWSINSSHVQGGLKKDFRLKNYEAYFLTCGNISNILWTPSCNPNSLPLIIPPANLVLNYNQGIGVLFGASDIDGIKNFGVNSSLFEINTSGFLVNATKIGVGVYNINISVFDNLDNVNSTIYTIIVNRADQTLVFNNIPAQIYGGLPVNLVATSSSGLPVTFNVISGLGNVVGNQLSFTGAGNVIVRASQSGDGNYTSAQIVDQTIVVNKGNVLITFANLTQTYNGNAKTVIVSVLPSLPYTITYNSQTQPPTNAGSYNASVIVNDINYEGFASSALVINRADQTINFPSLSDRFVGDFFDLSATSSSGLPVSFSIVSGSATLSGNRVTVNGEGSVTIRANQSGNSNYNSAQIIDNTFNVIKSPASITLSGLQQVYNGNPRAVVVQTNPINLVHTITYNGQTQAPINAGSYNVFAVISETAYSGNVSGVLVISKTNQTINFQQIPSQIYGSSPVSLIATSTAGLIVNFSIISGPGVVSGNQLSFIGAGNIAVRASQIGSNNYNPAQDIDQTISVSKASPVIIISNLSQVYNGNSKAVSVNVTPSLNYLVLYNNQLVSPIQVGTYLVNVSVDDVNYNGKENANLIILKSNQTINFASLPNRKVGDFFDLSATSSSGLPVSFSIISGPASLSGNTINLTGQGSVTIRANNSGNQNYNPAQNVDRTFSVTKNSALISLNGLDQTYDGTVKDVSVTTNPVGLPVSISYDGQTQAPINAGNYTVFAIVDHGVYEGNITGRLSIKKANQIITFDSIPDKFVNDSFDVISSSSSSLSVQLAVSGGATLFGNRLTINGPGEVVIRANQAGNNNYNNASEVARTFNAAKRVGIINIINLFQNYNGSEKAVIVSTVPVGLNTIILYNGQTQLPINAGSYNVSVNITDNVYSGSRNERLVVQKVEQFVVFNPVIVKVVGEKEVLIATSVSGIPISFEIVAGLALLNGNEINYTTPGTVTIKANNSGNQNYNPALLYRTISVSCPNETMQIVNSCIQVPPNVLIRNLVVSPTNNSIYQKGQSYRFISSVTGGNIDSVNLSLNGQIFTANRATGNDYEVIVNDLSAGNYNYRWIASNRLGTVNQTALEGYYIQKRLSQTLLKLNEFRGNITIFNGSSVILNASVVSGDVNSALTLSVGGSVVSSGVNSIIFSALFNSPGNYSVSVETFESQNYTKSNESWNIKVLENSINAPPIINIVYPSSQNYNIPITELKYNIIGEVQSCWYSVNRGINNISIPCGVNVSGLVSSNGSNVWSVYARNSLGLNSSSSVIFNVSIPLNVICLANETINCPRIPHGKFNGYADKCKVDGTAWLNVSTCSLECHNGYLPFGNSCVRNLSIYQKILKQEDLNIVNENGIRSVKYAENNLILFTINKSIGSTDIENITIIRSNQTDLRDFLIVRNLSFESRYAKSIIIRLKNLTSNGLCFVDNDAENLEDIKATCSKIACPGTRGRYNCEVADGGLTFILNGLRNSGAVEDYLYCGDNSCSSSESCSICPGDCGSCGTVTQPPTTNPIIIPGGTGTIGGNQNNNPVPEVELEQPNQDNGGSNPNVDPTINIGGDSDSRSNLGKDSMFIYNLVYYLILGLILGLIFVMAFFIYRYYSMGQAQPAQHY